eukprot:tig00022099_g23806.t2
MSRPQGTPGSSSFIQKRQGRARSHTTQTDTSLERVALHGIFPKLAAKRVHPAQGKLASPFQSVGVQVAGVDLLSGLTKLEAEAALRSGTLESAYLREIDEYRPFIIAVVGASAAQPSPSPPPPARRTPSPSPAPPDPPGAAPPPNAPDGPSSTAAAELLTAAPGAVPVEGAAGAGDDPAPPQPEEAHRFPEEEEEEEDGARLGERVLERVLEAAVLGEAVPEAQRRRAVLCLPRPTRPGPDDAPGSLRARLRRLQGPRLLDGYDDPRDAAAFALQSLQELIAGELRGGGAGGGEQGYDALGEYLRAACEGTAERPTALAHLNLEVLAPPGGDDGDDEADGEAARASPRDGAPGWGPSCPRDGRRGARAAPRCPGAGRTALLARWASSLRGRPERYALVAHFEEGPEPPPGAPTPLQPSLPAPLPARPPPPVAACLRAWGAGLRAFLGGPWGPDEEEALESGAEERGAGLPPGSIALRALLARAAARAAAEGRALVLLADCSLERLGPWLPPHAPPGWRALDLPPLSPDERRAAASAAAAASGRHELPAALLDAVAASEACGDGLYLRLLLGAALAPDAAAGPAAAPPRSSRRGCWAPAPTPPASRRAAWGSSRGGTLRLGCGGPCAPSSAAAPASRTTSSSSSPAPSPLLGRRRRLRRHPPPPPPRPGAPRRGRDGHPGASAGRLADFFAPRLLAAAGSGPAAPAPEALPFELRRAIAELPWQLAESGRCGELRRCLADERVAAFYLSPGGAGRAPRPRPPPPVAAHMAREGAGDAARAALALAVAHVRREGGAGPEALAEALGELAACAAAAGTAPTPPPSSPTPPPPSSRPARAARGGRGAPPPKSEALARALRRLGAAAQRGGSRGAALAAFRRAALAHPAGDPLALLASARCAARPAEADALLQAGPLPSPPSSPRLTAAPRRRPRGSWRASWAPPTPAPPPPPSTCACLLPPLPHPFLRRGPGPDGSGASSRGRPATRRGGAPLRARARGLALQPGGREPLRRRLPLPARRARRPLPLLTPSFLPLRPPGRAVRGGPGELARARGLYEAARGVLAALYGEGDARTAAAACCVADCLRLAPAAARPTSPPPAASTRPPCPASAPARPPRAAASLPRGRPAGSLSAALLRAAEHYREAAEAQAALAAALRAAGSPDAAAAAAEAAAERSAQRCLEEMEAGAGDGGGAFSRTESLMPADVELLGSFHF